MILHSTKFRHKMAKLTSQNGAKCANSRLMNGSNGSLKHLIAKGATNGTLGTF
jgi:hypothetical protein